MNKDTIEPGQPWEVDLFKPEDAPGVARLFLSVYGEGYPIRTYIEPERLIRENAAGRTISSVARTPKGDVIGHNALYNTAPFHGVYESGAGVVHADYRGGAGIFSRLVAHGQDVAAREFEVHAIFGESVCNHVFSQKMCNRLGWISHAVEVDLMPAAAYEKERSATGRVASILDFKTLLARPHRVFIPPSYEDELRFIYSGLDDQREISLSCDKPARESTTRIESQYFDFAQVSRMAVWESGDDFVSLLEQQEKDMMEKGVVVLQAWLNLSEPWAAVAVDALRERGYFLGGILPRWFGSDGMLMQKVMKHPDWEGIQTHFERAGRLLEWVKGDWMRLADASGVQKVFSNGTISAIKQ